LKQLTEWQEKEFNDFLKEKIPGVVEFGAPWCGACKMTEPVLAELSANFPSLKFAKIDVAKNPGLASRMGVMSLPNVLLVNGGHVKEQIIGAASKKSIEEKIAKLCLHLKK
jgi:thioredoxin 1